MNKRLRELKNYQKNSGLLPKKKKPIHRIVVTLMANKSVNGKVFVNYLSSNAGWIPHYDFRTKRCRKSESKLQGKSVSKYWFRLENVKINISTNNPYQNKNKTNITSLVS